MIIVFLGPSLSHAEATQQLAASYAPPAVQGDIYRAVRDGASMIGLVDGHFDSVPSVWHKEILWALAEGIPVYGSASMGALRAAELCAFGMVGVGSVFEQYKDGRISDDDEVALSHLLVEHDYRHITEPLVDIRATIDRAVQAGVISALTGEMLIRAAKSLHYADRTYSQLTAAAHSLAEREDLERFEQWWPANRFSVKRADAIAMLRAMKLAIAPADDVVPAPSFWFERTALWDDLVRGALDWSGRTASLQGVARTIALDSDAGADPASRDLALARLLARDLAHQHNFRLDDDRLADAIVSIRKRHNLLGGEELDGWMKANDLDRAQFLRFAADEARLAWVRDLLCQEVDSMIADHLRSVGKYQLISSDISEPH